MTLQERQKREIESLESEIEELWKLRRASREIDEIETLVVEIDAAYFAIQQVTHNPEKYFENIDKEE